MQKIEDNEKHLSSDTWKHQLPYPKALCRKKKIKRGFYMRNSCSTEKTSCFPPQPPPLTGAPTHWHSHKAEDGGREIGGDFPNIRVALVTV